jgi:hypothetical protein
MNPVCDLMEPLVEKDTIFNDLLTPKKKKKAVVEIKMKTIAELFKNFKG